MGSSKARKKRRRAEKEAAFLARAALPEIKAKPMKARLDKIHEKVIEEIISEER